MATVSKKHGPRKPSSCLPPSGSRWVTALDPQTGTGRLEIDNHRGDTAYYLAQVLDVQDTAIRSAIRLERVDNGKVYVVHQDWHGLWHCECADFLYRREFQDSRGCKHCQAMAGAERVQGPILPLPRPQAPLPPKPQPRPAAQITEGKHCPECGDDTQGQCECGPRGLRLGSCRHEEAQPVPDEPSCSECGIPLPYFGTLCPDCASEMPWPPEDEDLPAA